MFFCSLRELMPTLWMSVSDHMDEYFAAAASLLNWIFGWNLLKVGCQGCFLFWPCFVDVPLDWRFLWFRTHYIGYERLGTSALHIFEIRETFLRLLSSSPIPFSCDSFGALIGPLLSGCAMVDACLLWHRIVIRLDGQEEGFFCVAFFFLFTHFRNAPRRCSFVLLACVREL